MVQIADFFNRNLPRGYGGANTGWQRGCHARPRSSPTRQELSTKDKGAREGDGQIIRSRGYSSTDGFPKHKYLFAEVIRSIGRHDLVRAACYRRA